MNVAEIIEQAKQLPLDDVKKLREALDEHLREQSPTPEQKVEQMLFEAGLIREIKPPITDFTPYQNRQRAEILSGKPISETVIEDRR